MAYDENTPSLLTQPLHRRRLLSATFSPSSMQLAIQERDVVMRTLKEPSERYYFANGNLEISVGHSSSFTQSSQHSLCPGP